MPFLYGSTAWDNSYDLSQSQSCTLLLVYTEKVYKFTMVMMIFMYRLFGLQMNLGVVFALLPIVLLCDVTHNLAHLGSYKSQWNISYITHT